MESSKISNILILGAGNFAAELADIITGLDGIKTLGFVEGVDKENYKQTKNGLPVWWIDDIKELNHVEVTAVCAIGSPKRKNIVQQVFDIGFGFTSIIHPSAQLFPSADVGEDVFINALVVVASHTIIENHVILNRGCLIGHHSHLGEYVTVSPGANIAGKVHIGSCSYIGMGAIILDSISIGENVIVGAGSVVTHDVPDRVQVVGIPARVVKNL